MTRALDRVSFEMLVEYGIKGSSFDPLGDKETGRQEKVTIGETLDLGWTFSLCPHRPNVSHESVMRGMLPHPVRTNDAFMTVANAENIPNCENSKLSSYTAIRWGIRRTLL